MTEIRHADAAARRRATWLVIGGAAVGALLILAFARYRPVLRDWIGSDTREAPRRLQLAFVLLAALLSAPVLAFAAYLWAFGAKVLRGRSFPPAGSGVVRDTVVVRGRAATMRGRAFQALAVGLGLASLLLGVLVWRLARALTIGAP